MHPIVTTRRNFLRAGAVAGLGLADLFRLQAVRAGEPSRADVNCIFLFMLGGMSHHDLWDYKPDAPAEVRGEFKPIRTNVPGLTLTELLPRVATVADQLAILRGVTHADSDHGRGFHIMMTGMIPGPAGDFNVTRNNNVHPSFGSMVARMAGGRGTVPPYISVPCFLRSGGPAFLGPSYAPFVIEADPAAPEFAVRDVTPPPHVSAERLRRRRDALDAVNRSGTVEDRGKDVQAIDTFYQKAHGLLSSQAARDAFDLRREKESVRESYGMTSLGQCCLLARRLVEAGCRFVTVENGHWDTHRDNGRSLRDLLVPSVDRALPALLRDLKERGLLDKTLVVLATEFGRTPRINTMAGRDHWPNAFSLILAGGGVRGGCVLGATDKLGATVTERPVTPGDVAATILYALGVDPAAVLHTPLGRPVELASGGKPVLEVF